MLTYRVILLLTILVSGNIAAQEISSYTDQYTMGTWTTTDGEIWEVDFYMAYDENGSYTGDGFVGFTRGGVSDESIDGYINPTLKLENITSTSAINDNHSYNGEKFIGWEITIADMNVNSLIWFGLAATEKTLTNT